MDRPETIELVGQTLRWRGERHECYESAPIGARPRLVANQCSMTGGVGWECVAFVAGDVRLDVRAPTLEALDLALRAALSEVADAVAAWLPEREARDGRVRSLVAGLAKGEPRPMHVMFGRLLAPDADMLVTCVTESDDVYELTEAGAREFVERVRAEEREQTFRGVMQMVPAEHRIACREGGGPEDVEGSVSLSIARMRSLIPAVRT